MNWIIKSIFYCASLLGIAGTLCSPVTAATMAEYTKGHADIGLSLESGDLFLHYQFGSGSFLDGVELTSNEKFVPSEAYVRVASEPIVFPAGSTPLGIAPGEQAWILPQQANPDLPFLGFATGELFDFGFNSAGFRLLTMTGPLGGNFILFQDPLESPNVIMQTLGGIDSSADVLEFPVGGHNHYNFAFTKEGIYDLQVEGFASRLGEDELTDIGVFRFVVGSATAVPEPTSLMLLAACGAGVLATKRRKRS